MEKKEKVDISYMGPIFKKYRIKSNRTQEEVAEKVDISSRFLIAIENQKGRPSLDNLLRLVDTLNIPGDAILHPQLRVTDGEDDQIIRLLKKLNHRDKKVILSAIQAMLDSYGGDGF